jgi:hypothetical protein
MAIINELTEEGSAEELGQQEAGSDGAAAQ